MSVRAISYGGGVQSTALLVLAVQRRIDYPLAVMANVGDDSERPATLGYVRDVAAPYAAEHGVELCLVERTKRDGTVETLWGRLMRPLLCRSSTTARVTPDGGQHVSAPTSAAGPPRTAADPRQRPPQGSSRSTGSQAVP